MIKNRLKLLSFNATFILLGLLYLIPFFMVFVNSFKTVREARKLNLALPTEWKYENYSTVIEEAKLVLAAGNGLIFSVTTMVIVLLFCSMTAYILSRRQDRKTKLIYNYIMMGLIVPVAVIPTFLILTTLQLQGTYIGLILLYSAGATPFAVFLYYGFIKTIPTELDEAAIVDGAGRLRIFFTIVFPLLKPITVTAGIFTFMNVWNDFSTQLIFGSSKIRSMPPSVYAFFGKYMQSWNLVFADIMLTILPIVIIYIFAQRYIIGGMTAGAVKG